MLTKLQISIEDLNPEWIRKLKERYNNARLEIIVH